MGSAIDWIEAAALENLRFHIESAEKIASRSNTTLGFLAGGAAGSLAYAINDSPVLLGPPALAFGILAVWLFLCAAALVLKCQMVRPIHTPTNEPRNLLHDGIELEVLRRTELDNIQLRIDDTARRNRETGRWLNYTHLAALAGIAVAIVAALWFQVAAANLCGSVAAAG